MFKIKLFFNFDPKLFRKRSTGFSFHVEAQKLRWTPWYSLYERLSLLLFNIQREIDRPGCCNTLSDVCASHYRLKAQLQLHVMFLSPRIYWKQSSPFSLFTFPETEINASWTWFEFKHCSKRVWKSIFSQNTWFQYLKKKT